MNLQYLFGSIVLSIRTALLQIRYFDVEIGHKNITATSSTSLTGNIGEMELSLICLLVFFSLC